MRIAVKTITTETPGSRRDVIIRRSLRDTLNGRSIKDLCSFSASLWRFFLWLQAASARARVITQESASVSDWHARYDLIRGNDIIFS